MKDALLQLIHLGAGLDDQFENRRILITNLLSFMSLAFSVFYSSFYALVGWWQPFFLYIPFNLIYISTFFLNAKGFNRLTPIVVLFSLTLKMTVFPLLYLGREGGLHFFLLVLPAASFLTISKKDKAWIWIYVIYCYLSFLFVEYGCDRPLLPYADLGRYAPFLNIFSLSGVMGAIAVLILFAYINLNQAQEKLAVEHQRAERLLHNILPVPIAERLKLEQQSIAERFPATTILFADIVGFTPFSKDISPDRLVSILNQVFSLFDALTDRYGLEKIKTIGDAYMVAGGIPVPSDNHARAIAEMGLDMLDELRRFNRASGYSFQLRIGIHTGEVVAGVIGTKKFSYDLWGDAVNTASRMESQGIAGEIQVSENSYHLLKDGYRFEERGIIDVKGKGKMRVYLLKGRKLTSVSEEEESVADAQGAGGGPS